MDLGLKGKSAIVGGSSRGLGRAVAEELAAEGVDVVICARDADTLEGTKESIRGLTGSRVVAVPANLSEPADVEKVVAAGVAEFGKIDILVTNTGGPPSGKFEELTADDWQVAVRQLLESTVNFARSVLPGMKSRGWGRIINLTSIAVKQPVDGLMLSNSVRAGVTGFARTLANEVAPFGVTVNNVLPGYTRTDRLVELAEQGGAAKESGGVQSVFEVWEREVPMGRLGEPRELAALVAFLASERASYITGASITVDGGWTRSLL